MALSRSLIFLKDFSYCSKLNTQNKYLYQIARNLSNIYNEDKASFKKDIKDGPGLDYFILNSKSNLTLSESKKVSHPFLKFSDLDGSGRKIYFEVRGCAMNTNDADVAWSILKQHGYALTDSYSDADVAFLVTCSIRDSAEEKVLNKLKFLHSIRKKKKKPGVIGVLGCMAERLKKDLIDKEKADLVAGPDSYRDLPRLLALSSEKQSSINVLLSHDETYADINPVSISDNRVSAYVSIMRGCNNMCSYCIVPYTRGRERSRDIESIVNEIKYLSDNGIKQVTLLGQNVNSYRDLSQQNYATSEVSLAKNFETIYKNTKGGMRFADLLDKVSSINPEMRIRFTSPHPKDFPNEVLQIIKERHNICNNIHLPAQCGSSRLLKLMKRGYTREVYLELASNIRSIIPSISLTSDMIAGFCSETEEEFESTLSLMEEVRYNFCYVFPYSMRQKTSAHRNLTDDVPVDVKKQRADRMANTFRLIALNLNKAEVGKRHLILIEGKSKRSPTHIAGRNNGCCKVIIPKIEMPVINSTESREAQPGDYVVVQIAGATSQVMQGIPIGITTLQEYYS